MALLNSGKETEEKEMSFFDHLEELRRHLVRAILYIIAAGTVLFMLKDVVFGKIIFAPKNAEFLSYKAMCWFSEKVNAGQNLCMEPVDFNLITTQLGETFIIHLKVSIVGGVIVAFPFVFWEFWKFIKPGLLENEIKSTRGVVGVCSFLFLSGVLFGYFVISPFAVNFLAGYDISQVEHTVTMSSFVNYMIMFTLPTGLAFELPLVIYYLSKIGIMTPEFMRQYRRHSIVIILILAAVITPPDIITQLLIGFPLFFLYEVSIYISAREQKKRELALR